MSNWAEGYSTHGRVDVMIDPDEPDSIAVSVDGRYSFGIDTELAESLRQALNGLVAY